MLGRSGPPTRRPVPVCGAATKPASACSGLRSVRDRGAAPRGLPVVWGRRRPPGEVMPPRAGTDSSSHQSSIFSAISSTTSAGSSGPSAASAGGPWPIVFQSISFSARSTKTHLVSKLDEDPVEPLLQLLPPNRRCQGRFTHHQGLAFLVLEGRRTLRASIPVGHIPRLPFAAEQLQQDLTVTKADGDDHPREP